MTYRARCEGRTRRTRKRYATLASTNEILKRHYWRPYHPIPWWIEQAVARGWTTPERARRLAIEWRRHAH